MAWNGCIFLGISSTGLPGRLLYNGRSSLAAEVGGDQFGMASMTCHRAYRVGIHASYLPTGY